MSKRFVRTIVIAAAGGFWAASPQTALAQTTVSVETTVVVEHDVSFFYDELGAYGHWFAMEPYGWVWRPHQVGHDWRPYTVGHWELTHEHGWLWVSDFDWGWAPFHYGRWTYEPGLGWLWIPGTEWGPAWVAWREGGGHVGWAPLPPQAQWHAEAGLHWGGVDIDVVVQPSHWVFVEEHAFVDVHVHKHYVPYAQNVVVLHSTRDATRYDRRDGRVVNVSISVDNLERRLGRRIARRALVATAAGVAKRRAEADGDRITLFRPHIGKRAASKAPAKAVRANSPMGRRAQFRRNLREERREARREAAPDSQRMDRPAEDHPAAKQAPARAKAGPQREQDDRREKAASPKSKKRRD